MLPTLFTSNSLKQMGHKTSAQAVGSIKAPPHSHNKLKVTAYQRLQINGFGVAIDKGRTA